MTVKLPNLAAVQCLHDADAGEHRRSIQFDNEHKGLDRGLPFGRSRFFLGKRGKVGGGVP